MEVEQRIKQKINIVKIKTHENLHECKKLIHSLKKDEKHEHHLFKDMKKVIRLERNDQGLKELEEDEKKVEDLLRENYHLVKRCEDEVLHIKDFTEKLLHVINKYDPKLPKIEHIRQVDYIEQNRKRFVSLVNEILPKLKSAIYKKRENDMKIKELVERNKHLLA